MEVIDPKTLTEKEVLERLQIIRYKVYENEIGTICTQFEKAGYAPILIKGWAAAQLYPEPFQRQFTDIDLMIEPGLYEDALKFAETIKKNFPVDLHRGARHLDSVSYRELFSNTGFAQCGAAKIRVLRAEDHLRVLSVHWLNDGGADKEKLWDIYYGVANRPENFDWERFLNIVGAKRRCWLICAVGLAHKYLDLDLSDTPICEEAKKMPKWLTEAVEKEWESGVRLQPLNLFLRDKKNLWEQIKKRTPPNPIQATVELEGEFDDKPRIIYQLRSILPRVFPSVKRIARSISIEKKSDE
jgi:hypothetical protein